MHELAQRIAAFIGDENAGSFEDLALALFARQFEENAPYRRLSESLGTIPATVKGWRDIPAVPAAAFKRFELSCRPVEDCPVVFHSSGTTAEQTSRHYMDPDALALYEMSLAKGYRGTVGAPSEIWALMPPASQAPHSSLSHMLATLGASRWFWGDPAELAQAIKALPLSPTWRGGGGSKGAGGEVPITLFGTAFSFAGCFDQMSDPTPLPEGSIIVETGGYKGRTREIPRHELYGLFTSRFGVPPERCYGEYGMCEMASQFYSRGPAGVFAGPHWARTRAIDPVTGDDTPPGEVGLLRHYDLGNFNSVLAIQTQDRGVVQPDGRFKLLGRAPDAEVRGCSLAVEELWASRK